VTTSGGLLIAGLIVPVTGLTVIPPRLPPGNGPDWAYLDIRDYRMRKTRWVRQVIIHSVTGDDNQHVVPGAGPGGEAARYADIWRTDPVSSAAQVLVDSAGTVVCLCDLAYTCAYHAEGSNDWSVGIEMFVAKDGTIRQATIDATALIASELCDALGIPFQFHCAPYSNAPLLRMEVRFGEYRHNLGGPDCVGVFGHRDNTSARGRGDPGDAIYGALHARGAEALDYASEEDLHIGRARQTWLNAEASRRGLTNSPLVTDGFVGPASLARARLLGIARWRDVPAR